MLVLEGVEVEALALSGVVAFACRDEDLRTSFLPFASAMKVIPLMTTSRPGLIFAFFLSSIVCSISPSSGSSVLEDVDGNGGIDELEPPTILAADAAPLGVEVPLLLLFKTSLRCTLLCVGCACNCEVDVDVDVEATGWLAPAAVATAGVDDEGVHTLFVRCLAGWYA